MKTNNKRYGIHPLCEALPKMSAEAFAELKADIQKHGLRDAIWLKGKQIIDGRHRYRACCELGITATTRQYQGEDLEAFVISTNLARRHLSTQQRKWFAKRLLELHPEQSSRSIAKSVGLDHKSVERIRQSTGENPQLPSEVRIGADGKCRPAKVKRPRGAQATSLITAADLESRRFMRWLTELHPSELTESDRFIRELSEQLARIETLARREPIEHKR